MKKNLIILLLSFTLFLCPTFLMAMMKEQLFRTPKILAAKISPKGERLAYVGADENGVPNLFITKDLTFNDPKQVTFFDTPDLIQFFWPGDGSKLVLLKEDDGNSQHHLYGVDLDTLEIRHYTKLFEGVAKILHVSEEENRVAVGLNFRNNRFHDVYALDLDTHQFDLLYENEVYAKFFLDDSLSIKLKLEVLDDGSWRAIDEDDQTLVDVSVEESFHTEFLQINDKLYFLDCRDTNTQALMALTLEDLSEEVLGHQEESDIDEVFFIGGKPVAYASYYIHKKWHAIDPLFVEDLEKLDEDLGSSYQILSRDKLGAIWLLRTSIPDQGTRYWIYEREEKTLHALSEELEPFAKMYPLVTQSRDGLELISYYTLPKEVDQEGSLDEPIPLVVFPHGGPYKVRDRYEFNPHHQWFASQGYAVLSVNFRLSSGFGKEFVNAGSKRWGKEPHLDIIDVVNDCIDKGITEKGKIAVVGGSYGGYEALASLAFTPDFFNCAVAICGPSHLQTILDGLPNFWEWTPWPLADRMMFFTRISFIHSIGAKDLDVVKSGSPLNYVDQIRKPLLLIHGENDHIVKASESRQIYEKLNLRGKDVSLLSFPDEGHRIAKFANKMKYMEAIEEFLEKHLSVLDSIYQGESS